MVAWTYELPVGQMHAKWAYMLDAMRDMLVDPRYVYPI